MGILLATTGRKLSKQYDVKDLNCNISMTSWKGKSTFFFFDK